MRPPGNLEAELRNRGARRGVLTLLRSPLARRIILFNMLALVLLAAGVLFTNPFRDTLLRQHETALRAQAEALSDILAASDGPARVRALAALRLPMETEVMLIDPAGEVVFRHAGGDQVSRADPPRRTVISDALEALWSGFAAIAPPPSPPPEDATVIADLLPAARGGATASRVVQQGAQLRMLVAVPIGAGGEATSVLVLRQVPRALSLTLRAEREQVLQMFVVAFLVSVGLSLVLASTIANPLSDLATAAELGRDRQVRRISPERVRIPDLAGRPDEIGRLSVAMRGMVSALYDRIDANEQFAADVAHEIKNPLASLRSAVGALRMTKREDQIVRLLDVIEHDVRRIDRLISDTSNASRLDSELVKETEETFDLCGTLEALSRHLAQEAEAQGIEFVIEMPAEPVMIQGLEARLAQVFVNLISNAISFSQSGDVVRVWARKRANRALVVVEDTGPGIPEAALDKIFKRFYSERPESQFGNHSGLGLAISKQIVEAHGGVIWAENIRAADAAADSPPLGARFVVGLPL
ncbi:sensor histidine kinase [Pararhodobacter sp. SW119]|uniref:sensor histidine kinase n=1 Tax=Pararhodobacter sp. SW119 TaxID=2780075 RepID=UPI001AE03F11|nr:sensor histidine kinase [Pararhodobacter sp. SW119]